MQKYSRILRLVMIALLVVGMAFTTTALFAQEGGAPAAEGAQAEPAAAEAAATNPLVPLGINTGFLVAQIINFLLIFGLLSFAIWRPLMNMLDNRAATIQKGLEDAAAAAAARRSAEADAEKVLATARAEAARIVEEARGRGDEVAKGIEAEARTAAEAIRAEARVRAEEERNRQLADLRGQVVSIATAMSQRIIGETLDAQRQQALVSDFFAKVPEAARSMGSSVEVISAMPLSSDEQNNVRGQVGAEHITFTVDPSILGGLVIRSADRVVDGSVRSNLSDLAGRLR
jgi:F-type H+-transporting ATPase subunit b